MTISGLRSINNNTTVVGLLVAMGVLPTEEIGGYAALGEMALDGRIGSVAGMLPAAIHTHACERGGIHLPYRRRFARRLFALADHNPGSRRPRGLSS